MEAIEQRERREITRRARRYREERPRLDLKGRCAVIVDDGIATGSTAHVACRVARAHGAARVVLAVPVAPKATAATLLGVCDEFLCVATPESFTAVGEWYGDFFPTSDEQVIHLLRRST
jgi:putative phosphoribosyl transferase